MYSPYEELEYLADHLPEEGESVLVTRERGELVCQPCQQDELRDGIHDAELYGFLVRANEQLHNMGAVPLWCCLFGLIWLGLILHGIVGLGWAHWYIIPTVALPVVYGCFHWIQHRQQKHFENVIQPELAAQMARRRIVPFALIAGVRQHGELRSLLDELVRCAPVRNCR